jgi:hypothetical protein
MRNRTELTEDQIRAAEINALSRPSLVFLALLAVAILVVASWEGTRPIDPLIAVLGALTAGGVWRAVRLLAVLVVNADRRHG